MPTSRTSLSEDAVTTIRPRTAKEIIAGAKRQRRTIRINLAGHLMADLERLEDELADIQRQEAARPDDAKPRGRLGAKSPAVLKAQEIVAKQEEMADYWLNLVIEQKPFATWREFKTANPPRDGQEYDDSLTMNFDNLVTQFMPTCVVEPELDAEDWAGIFEKAAPGDLRDVGAAVFRLHEARLDIPLSRNASRVITTNGESSEPLDPME